MHGKDNIEEPVDSLSENQEDAPEELYERMKIVVDGGQEPMRLDKFLTARMEGASRNKVQQAIETGRVLINNKKVQANHKIKPEKKLLYSATGRFNLMKSFQKIYR